MIVEFVLGLMIACAVLAGWTALGRLVVARHRAQRLARFGALLQSTGRVSEAVARRAVEEYAAALAPSAVWQIEMGRFLATPSSRFYRLTETRVRLAVSGFSAPITESAVCQQEPAS